MAIAKLKRVMQDILPKQRRSAKYSRKLGKDIKIVKHKEIKKAIYRYIGTDRTTVERNIIVLRELGWIKRLNRYDFVILEEYITDDDF